MFSGLDNQAVADTALVLDCRVRYAGAFELAPYVADMRVDAAVIRQQPASQRLAAQFLP